MEDSSEKTGPHPRPPGDGEAARYDSGTITELALSAAAGDRDARNRLVERLTPFLMHQARAKMPPRLVALLAPEDLVQDVWERAIPRLADVAAEGGHYSRPFLRWLSRFLKNRLDSISQRKAPPVSLDDPQGPVTGSRSPDLQDDRTGVVTRACRDETSKLVHEKIELLPARDRAVVLARGIEDRNYTEIAAELAISVENVRMIYHRARARLRLMLPAYLVEELTDT